MIQLCELKINDYLKSKIYYKCCDGVYTDFHMGDLRKVILDRKYYRSCNRNDRFKIIGSYNSDDELLEQYMNSNPEIFI